MKHTSRILVLGLIVGLVAHFTYFRLRVSTGDAEETRLLWMRKELKLTDTQYARIKMLHEASGPYLHELAARVARMRAEFAVFEAARRGNAAVDFVEFAHYVEARQKLNADCAASKNQLVLAATEVMDPEQRVRYLGMIAATPAKPSLFD